MGEGSMGPSGGGSMVSGPGPYAAAASALIAPTPGGVAGKSTSVAMYQPSSTEARLEV